MRPLRILTWPLHGRYLSYLTGLGHEWLLPVLPGRPEGYGGRPSGFEWGANVREIGAEDVRHERLDAVLFQADRNWERDQFEILDEGQRRLPRLYLEHDPPRESPAESRHPVDDPDVLLVQVSPFNALMWDSGRTPWRVIEPGVPDPGISPTYELERGIAVVNDIARRGRRLGRDVLDEVRRQVPVDLAGANSAEAGGMGEIPPAHLPILESRYRFFFNPVRYSSPDLVVCEAMMLGLPVVGLATTEMATVVENGVSGFVGNDLDQLVARMRILLADPGLAQELGRWARERARERFGLDRFLADWDSAIAEATAMRPIRHGNGRAARRPRIPSEPASPAQVRSD